GTVPHSSDSERAAAINFGGRITELCSEFGAGSGMQTSSISATSEVLGAFWQLLQKLFMRKHGVNQSWWCSYAVFMFVCCNGQTEHAFAKPTKFWPAIVRLLYWARGAISQYIKLALGTSSIGDMDGDTCNRLLMENHAYLEDNRPTACGSLFGLNGILTKAQNEYYMQTRIVYVNGSDKKTLEFDGKQISMTNIADAYFYAVNSIHKLFGKLLCSFAYDKSVLRLINMEDNFGDDCVSCGFISHNQASIGQLCIKFLAHLTQKRLLQLSEDRGHVIQTDSTKAWLKNADELMHYILFAIYLGYGQPARATELATLTFNNLPNFYHGVFVSKAKGAVCLSSVYWKSQQQQQRSRQVLQFINPQLSQLLCTFLAIIRPADYAIRQENPSDTSDQSCQRLKSTYMHYLFVHSDAYFQENTDADCGEDPDDDDAMHFFHHSPNVSQSQDLLDNTSNQWEAIDEQAGHSHNTADLIYGKSVESMTFVSAQLFEHAYLACSIWHHALYALRSSAAAASYQNGTHAIQQVEHCIGHGLTSVHSPDQSSSRQLHRPQQDHQPHQPHQQSTVNMIIHSSTNPPKH
ncbi:hypothetical protein H4R24_005544, partial [Coemansia sp. RSA 988]